MRLLSLFFLIIHILILEKKEKKKLLNPSNKIVLAHSLYIRDVLHMLVFCVSVTGIFYLGFNIDHSYYESHTLEFK